MVELATLHQYPSTSSGTLKNPYHYQSISVQRTLKNLLVLGALGNPEKSCLSLARPSSESGPTITLLPEIVSFKPLFLGPVNQYSWLDQPLKDLLIELVFYFNFMALAN